MAALAIYFSKQFLLSRKQLRKSIGLLRKYQNVLPKSSKLFIRPHHGHGHFIYDHS